MEYTPRNRIARLNAISSFILKEAEKQLPQKAKQFIFLLDVMNNPFMHIPATIKS